MIDICAFNIEANPPSEIAPFVKTITGLEQLKVELWRRKFDVLILNADQVSQLPSVTKGDIPSIVLAIAETNSSINIETAEVPVTTVLHCAQKTDIWSLISVEIERLMRPRLISMLPTTKMDTVLVGSGIVNLITALELIMAGHKITVLDRMPDPMKREGFDHLATGATFGGMDARIFSLNESRHHLFRGNTSNVTTHWPFMKRVSNGGWLSRDYDELILDEKNWIDRLQRLPTWLSGIYNNDIISYNKESAPAWDELFMLHPQLLRGVNYNSTLLRVYQTEASFTAAQRLEHHLGSCHEIIPNDILVQRQPCFTEAIAQNAIAGALKVEGFSLSIKSFSRNLIRLLSSKGVHFRWNTSVDAICRDDNGRVNGLRVGADTVHATNIVICPGAYAALSCGVLPALSDIAAMVGMWITLPNKERPLTVPLKVRRRGFAASEAAEGANIIPGRDSLSRPVIYCSSGHGFLGVRLESVMVSDLHELLTCLKETCRDLFPDKYAEAEHRGMLDVEPEYCVRPWTSSGLGVFDHLKTADGGQLILTGGHNTGGFSQAPSVARAVRIALQGDVPKMAEIYHPKRSHAFIH